MAKTKTKTKQVKPQTRMTISVNQTLEIERDDLTSFLCYMLENVYENQGLSRGDTNWAWGQLADDNDFSCVLDQLSLEELGAVLPIMFPMDKPDKDVTEMISDFVRHGTLGDMSVPDEICDKIIAYLFPLMDAKVISWADGRDSRMSKKDLELQIRQDKSRIDDMLEHGWAWVDGKLVPPASFPTPKAPKVGLGVPVAKPVKPKSKSKKK